ncbi:hypothetical protein SUDANB105_06881 [Streptomyces sp. enrichment culture]|uniref:hypothetical protein n=1 Tax=Streptomyces sp. enrichment culture TaxID=1795815 RepID=UPI003F57AC14
MTLRSLPALAWLVGGLVVSGCAVGLLQAATPVIVVSEPGRSSADAGLIWSVSDVASLLAVTAARQASDRWGRWPVGAVAAAVAVSATVTVAQADTYRGCLLLSAVPMAGEGGLTVVLRTLRVHLIPSKVFGSTLSLTILLFLLHFPPLVCSSRPPRPPGSGTPSPPQPYRRPSASPPPSRDCAPCPPHTGL